MKRGFTLIEMIAVLLIVGVLALATAVALVPIARGFLQARDNGVIWTPDTMDSFLSDPKNYVPGNRMRHAPITDPDERRRVIARLIEATR